MLPLPTSSNIPAIDGGFEVPDDSRLIVDEIINAQLTDAEQHELANLSQSLVYDIPFCPWTPNEGPQSLFLLDFGRESLYGGAAGGGKDLCVETPIATPTGWTTMGQLTVGDAVFDERGNPCTVLAKSEVMHNPCVEIEFSDGERMTCGETHLWRTFSRSEAESHRRRSPEFQARRRSKRPSRATGNGLRPWVGGVNARRALDARDNSPLDKWDGATVRPAREVSIGDAIPLADPLNLPAIDLGIDPWVFGFWLGDGDTARGALTIGGLDGWVLDHLEEIGYSWNATTVDTHFRVPRLHTELRALGFCIDRGRKFPPKHIPQVFLRASVEQRLALLQGIVDSDGHVTPNGQVEVTWTNRTLVDGFMELLASLGIKATAREGRATLDGRDLGPKWRMKWLTDLPCARLPRKRLAQKVAEFRGTHSRRYVVTVRSVPTVPTQCIAVDSPSRLFLAGRGMIPTHNSIALLMAASQFLDVPGYAALLLRKSYSDLGKPGALMDVADEWWGPLRGHGVRFDSQQHTYEFNCPGGGKSKVVFGALDNENDRFKYQGGAYHFVGFDELTQQKERDYRYIFSRVRRRMEGAISMLPIRFRSTTNPGGVGHEWVYKRFIARWEKWRKGQAPRPRRNFWPALIDDNPKLDRADYVRSLMELDPVTRAQLMRGDWNIRPDGRMFRSRWFRQIKRSQLPGNCVWVRFWDFASTEPSPGIDPDYTVGGLIGKDKFGRIFIADVRRWRKDPGDNDALARKTGLLDTRRVKQVMEQEPGSAGKTAVWHYRQLVFNQSNFQAVSSSGKARGRTTTLVGRKTPPAKIMAAGPFASMASAGMVYVVVDGSWDWESFIAEFEIFPDGEHDDQVDAITLGYNWLMKYGISAANIGDANEGFEKVNEWRPEALPYNIGEQWEGGRMVEERWSADLVKATLEEQRRVERSVNDAWAI